MFESFAGRARRLFNADREPHALFELFTEGARRVIVLAQEEARGLNHNYIGTEHILLGLVHDEGVAAMALGSLGISLGAVREQVQGIIGQGRQTPSGDIPFTPRAKRVLELSLRESNRQRRKYVGTEHILLGLIHEGEGVASQVLVKLGANLDQTRQQVLQLARASEGPPVRTSSASSVLDQFGRDHRKLAFDGRFGPVVGRQKEIERVLQVLSRRAKNNPVLIGAPGVGKTAVVEGLSQAMVRGEIPETLKNKRLYSLSLGALVAGALSFAAAEERVNAIVAEVRARGDIILFIEELHAITGATEGTLGSAAPFRALLIEESVQIIATSLPITFSRLLDVDPRIEQRFQPIPIAAPLPNATIEMLRAVQHRIEAHHRVTITDQAIITAVGSAVKCFGGNTLPRSAIELLDEAGALLQIRRQAIPRELLEYDEKITRSRRDKEAAIDANDFETAAKMRDTERKLLSAKAEREKQWKAGDLQVVCEVDDALIDEVIERRQAEQHWSPPTHPIDEVSATRSSRKDPLADSPVDIWAIALAELRDGVPTWAHDDPGSAHT